MTGQPGTTAYDLPVAIDDASVHAPGLQVVQESPTEAVPPSRSRTATIPPTLEADLRLIRVHVDQQSQLLAALHQMVVTHTQHVDACLALMRTQIDAMSLRIDKLTEITEAISKHLGVAPAL